MAEQEQKQQQQQQTPDPMVGPKTQSVESAVKEGRIAEPPKKDLPIYAGSIHPDYGRAVPANPHSQSTHDQFDIPPAKSLKELQEGVKKQREAAAKK